MTDKTILKSYFNTGDIPTEIHFASLIDSIQQNLGLISVKDYGAVGDGVTDDTAAIVLAIAAAAATGGTIYFPSRSIYNVDTTAAAITITDKVSIEGADEYSTVINHIAGAVLFEIPGSHARPAFFKNLRITGGAPGSIAVRLRSRFKHLDHLYFKDYLGSCIYLYWENAYDFPWCNNITNISIDGYFTGSVSITEYGIRGNKNINVTSISNFYIAGCKYAGIEITGGASIAIHNGSIEHAAYDANTKCISIGTAAGGSPFVGPIRISNLYLEGFTYAGLYVERSSQMTLENCYIDGTGGTNGIYLVGDHIRIGRTRIIGCSVFGATNDLNVEHVSDLMIDYSYIATITTSEPYQEFNRDPSTTNGIFMPFDMKHKGGYLGFFDQTAVVRQNHIADPSGGTPDAEARTAINAILAALENYGLLKIS